MPPGIIMPQEASGSTQTIRAVKCFITWRYWLWRVHENSDIQQDGKEEGIDNEGNLNAPCRILLQFEGLEWLMYNRSMVFDDILEQVQKAETQNERAKDNKADRSKWSPETRVTSVHARELTQSAVIPKPLHEQPYAPFGIRLRLPRFDLPSQVWSWLTSQLPTFNLNDLLPIALQAKRGAIMLGNPSTPSRSSHDQYRQTYKLSFSHVSLTAEDNPDYELPMVETGKKLYNQVLQEKPGSMMGYAFSTFRTAIFGIPIFNIRKTEPPVRAPPKPWTGLSTFMTEAEKEQARRQAHEESKRLAEQRRHEVGPEYAIERNILETPSLEVIYYADVAGLVPTDPLSLEGTHEFIDIGNGDIAPQWGVDLVMHGGTLTYGPWADRQRAHLQKALFPPTYADSSPIELLKPGDTRVCTEFRLFLELDSEVKLRVPTREKSKDWQFDQLPDLGQSRRTSESGYATTLKIQLAQISMDSSVNNKVFLKAEACRIQCELPTPLYWRKERQWCFHIALQQPDIYLLRDHITLFTDLGKDWSSGPPTSMTHFIPMLYTVRLVLKDYAISLNVNDQNIIDSPTDPDANVLFTLKGSNLNSSVDIPSLTYRPEATTVPFSLDSADKLGLWLTFPKWNTRAAHATEQLAEIGRIDSIRVDGSYRYYSDVDPAFVDRLKLDIKGRTCTFKCFGWVIRHFMVLQANYFGSFTNFILPSEAIMKRGRGHPLGDPIDAKYREGQFNTTEVSMEIHVSDSTVVLPEAFLGYEKADNPSSGDLHGVGPCVLLAVPDLSLSFRLHDYAMEMTLNVHPVQISSEADCSDEMLWSAATHHLRRTTILTISELNIIAHRLFGPRPHNATYVCIWEIMAGDIRGTVSPSDIPKIAAALTSFQLNFKDELNAPAQEYMPELFPD
ncbi:15845_t:CDS:10, partial [Acaulospora colombiana]